MNLTLQGRKAVSPTRTLLRLLTRAKKGCSESSSSPCSSSLNFPSSLCCQLNSWFLLGRFLLLTWDFHTWNTTRHFTWQTVFSTCGRHGVVLQVSPGYDGGESSWRSSPGSMREEVEEISFSYLGSLWALLCFFALHFLQTLHCQLVFRCQFSVQCSHISVLGVEEAGDGGLYVSGDIIIITCLTLSRAFTGLRL